MVIDNAPGGAEDLALGIGETWVVTDAEGEAGGVVVVIDRAQRELHITAGPALQGIIPSPDTLTNVAGPSFRADDFDSGVAAILGTIENSFEIQSRGGFDNNSNDGGGGTVGTTTTSRDRAPGGGISLLPIVIFGAVAYAGISGLGSRKKVGQRRDLEKERRGQEVDDVLDRLETSAADLPDLRRYEVPEPAITGDPSTAAAGASLQGVADRASSHDEEMLRSLWSRDLLDVIDAKRLEADTEVPLELRASDDRDLLDDAVQDAAREALAVRKGDDDSFQVQLRQLQGLVASVRPFRVAEARRRFAATVLDRVSPTSFGATVVSDRGERLLKALPVIDAESLDVALNELDSAYEEAQRKVGRLDIIHDRLPDSSARPAVAAALTDLGSDPAQAVERYERVRQDLKKRSQLLERDQLDVDAIAALLLLNHDELSVNEFVQLYRVHRENRMKPALAVEYALAGLTTEREIARVRQYADGEGIPVAIVAALMRNLSLIHI